jgi:Uma2 family endonuclease
VKSSRARRRDYQDKSEEYLKAGIREYWIIDPAGKQVTLRTIHHDPDAPAWSERTFAGDDVIDSEFLPGFQGTVSQLWIDADSASDRSPGNGS